MASFKFIDPFMFLFFCFFTFVSAFNLDVKSQESVCAAAKLAADGTWNYYDGFNYGGVIGMFIPPNYWWNSGQTFGGLLDYYIFCDPTNDTLRKDIFDGMYSQTGDDFDYVPLNQTETEGNDDQGVWGLAILEAAERKFSEPNSHTWLELAENLFNSMNNRWDTAYCGGGLRWQIYEWNNGYNYKNTISNGCLFQIAARLARLTGNQTYFDVANKVWNWMEETHFLDRDPNGNFWLHDGAEIETDCKQVTPLRWSYNYGVMLAGSAYMYNITQQEKWKNRTNVILDASLNVFFKDMIMHETSCTRDDSCNNDQRSFRSLFSRCLALTSRVMPESRSKIMSYLEKSAIGAAASCSGGSDGITCGMDWSLGSWDGIYGLGEQIASLETIMSLIVEEPNPVEPRLFSITLKTKAIKPSSTTSSKPATSKSKTVKNSSEASTSIPSKQKNNANSFSIVGFSWLTLLLELL